MSDATLRTNTPSAILRCVALGIVLATVATAVVADRADPEVRRLPPASHLHRSGRSADLLCRLDEALPGRPPRREDKYAIACPNAPEDSRARVVPVGDDRRRALVLKAGESLEMTLPPGDAETFRFWAATRGLGDELDVRITIAGGTEPVTWARRLATHERWIDGALPLPADAAEITLTIETHAPRPRHRDARLALGAPRLVEASDPDERGAPNIVLYLIDTLRADHTPMYGYERNTMPRLGAMAERSVVFDRAYSTAARTRPATASVLTGLYPSRHHARLGRGIAFDEETLAEKLRDAGWSTWAYVANGNVFAPGFAFEQGFDVFQTVRGTRRDNHAYTEEINERMLPMLRTHAADEPFFLYVHAIDPHSPYDPPPAFAGTYRDPAYEGVVTAQNTRSRLLRKLDLGEQDIAHVRDLYDEDILYQDAMFGELLDTLEEAGVLDRTLIVVVSDHGDEFQEHGGWEHGNRLFEEQIRVPFLVQVPGADDGRRIEAPVSLADVTPTVLGLYGLAAPAASQGRDRSGLVQGSTLDTPREAIYAEEITNMPGGDVRTLIDGPWKLIRRSTTLRDDDQTEYQLFELGADPGEQSEIGAAQRERVTRMRAELLRRGEELSTAPPTEVTVEGALDQRTRRQLRALGYVEGD